MAAISSGTVFCPIPPYFSTTAFSMWYTSARKPNSDKRVLGITYAESTDGLVWRPKVDGSGEPIFMLEPTRGAWDEGGVETASVVKGRDGKYLMLYSGDVMPKGSNSWAIGAALSDDGLTWTKVKDPVLDANSDWEKPFFEGSGKKRVRIGGVSEPSVLYDPKQDVYKMWYAALGKRRSKLAFRMGYATSKDGLHWQSSSDPVLEPEEGAWDDAVISHVEVVADPRTGYHLFDFGASAKDYELAEHYHATMVPGGIGHAYSIDGLSWQRDANPVLDVLPNSPEAWMVGGPSALIENNIVKLWYFCSPVHNTYKFRIGLATATLHVQRVP